MGNTKVTLIIDGEKNDSMDRDGNILDEGLINGYDIPILAKEVLG